MWLRLRANGNRRELELDQSRPENKKNSASSGRTISWLRKLADVRLVTLAGWGANLLAYIFAAIGAAATWAQLRIGTMSYSESWVDKFGWRVFRDPLFYLIVAAAVYPIFNPGSWLRSLGKKIKTADERSIWLEYAFAVSKKFLVQKDTQKNEQHVRATWDSILRAAEIEVAEALNVSVETLHVNLLLLDSNDKFKVVARSKAGRPVPYVYTADERPHVWTAIQTNQTNQLSRVARNGRSYHSVIATPVAVDTTAYGAISVDSPEQDAFSTHMAVIDRILRPYCAFVAVTLRSKSNTLPCPPLFRH